jgi:2-C-methyl-D-erythritol 4-phosphate cytidylyltransferase
MIENDIYVSVVIVAAGRGKRMKTSGNKLFLETGGLPVLARTLEVFENCSVADEIILVVNENDKAYCRDNIVDKHGYQKVKKIIHGGETRQESVFNGLMEVDAECRVIAVHDGARPFIKKEIISECIRTAYNYGAACVAVPVKDTVKIVNREGMVVQTPDRSMLWSVQTPQAFKHEILLDAHKKAKESKFKGTDDAVLVERCGYPWKIIPGSYENIKITTSEDLILAEAIIKHLRQ